MPALPSGLKGLAPSPRGMYRPAAAVTKPRGRVAASSNDRDGGILARISAGTISYC